jgi:hypothetical protein
LCDVYRGVGYKLGGQKAGRLGGRKARRLEGRKARRLEGMEARRLGGWKVIRLILIEAFVLYGFPALSPCGDHLILITQ